MRCRWEDRKVERDQDGVGADAGARRYFWRWWPVLAPQDEFAFKPRFN